MITLSWWWRCRRPLNWSIFSWHTCCCDLLSSDTRYVSMCSTTELTASDFHLQVHVFRGKDGFGFTICSDYPVRVQAVDPGKKTLQPRYELTYSIYISQHLVSKQSSIFSACLIWLVVWSYCEIHEKHVRSSVTSQPALTLLMVCWLSVGGPAHQSGLRQGDLVLQLNGVPVETWKCVDLAHAIR